MSARPMTRRECEDCGDPVVLRRRYHCWACNKFVCDKHGVELPIVSKSYAEANGLPYGCGDCRRELVDAPDSTKMTPQERVTEMRSLLEAPCWAGFDAVWHRVDLLVGRGTYTHELAMPDMLAAEILGEGRTDPIESLRALAGDKPVVVVDATDARGGELGSL